jgi:alpha-mannosidase
MWQDTMLNQFHDVLPGTTISMVVDDVLAIYEKRTAQAAGLIESALNTLYPGSQAVAPSKADSKVAVIDPLRLGRTAIETTSGKAYQEGDKYILEDSDLKMTIAQGRIVSLFDIHLQRELILPGPGAQDGGFIMYEDFPLEWDAWDVEVYHLESFKVLKFDSISISGDALEAKLAFGQSKATVTVRSM